MPAAGSGSVAALLVVNTVAMGTHRPVFAGDQPIKLAAADMPGPPPEAVRRQPFNVGAIPSTDSGDVSPKQKSKVIGPDFDPIDRTFALGTVE